LGSATAVAHPFFRRCAGHRRRLARQRIHARAPYQWSDRVRQIWFRGLPAVALFIAASIATGISSFETRPDHRAETGLGGCRHGPLFLWECRSMLRVFIGLGIPFLAIAIFLPLVNIVPLTVMNIPFLYLWMFVWFILTSVCLSVCWFRFDRHRSEQI
jgi:hypothetical protein